MYRLRFVPIQKKHTISPFLRLACRIANLQYREEVRQYSFSLGFTESFRYLSLSDDGSLYRPRKCGRLFHVSTLKRFRPLKVVAVYLKLTGAPVYLVMYMVNCSLNAPKEVPQQNA